LTETQGEHWSCVKENNGSGIFGFIGQASGTTFTDNNIAPEKDDTPPTGENPFANGNYPGVVGYYQQRLVFAASNANPQTVWMSKTGAFHNFGYSTPTKDDDAITVTIASRQVNRIRHLVPLRELLVLTSGAEWTLSGDAGGLTPTNIQANVQSYIGASTVPPAVYGNTALYVQSRGQKLADLAYSYTSDGFQGQDLTVLSSHLVRGYEIQDMALAQVPNSCAWMVRSDGALLGFTYLPTQEVYSWHRHDTDGSYEAVASVPEGDEDALYVVVRRTVNGVSRRYIERFESRQLSVYGLDFNNGPYDQLFRSFFVDSGLTFDNRGDPEAIVVIRDDGVYTYPNELTITCVVPSYGPQDVGVTFFLEGEDGARLYFDITRYVSGTELKGIPKSLVPESLRGIPAAKWGKCASNAIGGLSHLEGKTVSILADGHVLPPAIVKNGFVPLAVPTVLAHIGLPFVSDFETLDLTNTQQPSFLGNKKRINDVEILCEESRGIFAGSDPDHLYEYKQRSTENYSEPTQLLTGRAQISISPKWDSAGRIFIRQTDPLPLTILGVLLNVQAGG